MSAYDKKEGGERVPLAEPSRGDDLTHDIIVDFEGVGNQRDTIHNEIGLAVIEAHVVHKTPEIVPFDAVIGFSHV